MIEVLVTLVIVAFGLLGLLGLQARALSFQKDSYDGRAAAELASQIGDRMKANMLGFAARNYADAMDPGAAPIAVPNCGGNCTAAQIATRDQAHWQQEVRRRLPTSGVYLVPDAVNPGGWPRFIDVFIVWQEPLQAANALAVVDVACAQVIAGPNPALPADYRCYRATVAP